MIEQFDRFEFKNTLENIASNLDYILFVKELGIVKDEYTFDIILDHKVAVRIRSSIHPNGISASTGKDSIRLWLVYHVTGTQLSKIPGNYVTRVAGWDKRLEDYILYLATLRVISGDCPECQHPLYIYHSKSEGLNFKRLFASCFNCRKTFHWLEDTFNGKPTPPSNVYFEPMPVSTEVESPAGDNSLASLDEVSTAGPGSVEDVPLSSDDALVSSSTVEDSTSEEIGDMDALSTLEEEEEEEESANTVDTILSDRLPNDEQAEAIFAPIDGAYRVLAPPGCLGGDTVVSINRAGKGYSTTISKLWQSFQRMKNKSHLVQYKTPTRIQYRTEDGTIRLMDICDVIDSGIRGVYQVTSESGKVITATGDHKFLTSSGMQPILFLRGKQVYVRCGQKSKGDKKKKPSYISVEGLIRHPFAHSHSKHKNEVVIHHLVMESHLNHIEYNEYILWLRGKIELVHQPTIFINSKTTEVHHRDGDPKNNQLVNLELLSSSEHKKRHANAASVLYKTELEIIVKIDYIGSERTYDIVLADVPHNFVANEFIVSNSGKTFLLIRRIRFLLHHRVSMANILAVTFNKNMADELQKRLVALMPSVSDDPWTDRNICTIHAACYRMLRDVGDKRAFPDKEMWKIKSFLQERTVYYWENEAIRPSWKEVLDWIYTAKHNGIEETDMLYYFINVFPTYAEHVNQIRIEFDKFMRESNYLLFGDMLYDVEMKLKHDPVFLRRFQTLYKYVLVDEGQDTSGQAMRILTTISAPQDNFFIVGDTDQLLYRFTGATPELNLYGGFEARFPDGRLIKLSTNYRSTRNIISTCNRMIGNNYSDRGGPYEQKYMKDVQPRQDALFGNKLDFMICSNPRHEAETVAGNMLDLLTTYKPRDIFVGARTRAQLTYLEPYLMKADIPFINLAGSSFWDSRPIQDMVSFLKVVTNPYDTEAFARIYNIASANFVHPWGDQKGEYCTHHYLPRLMLAEVKDYFHCRQAIRSYRFPYKYSWKVGMEDIVELVSEMQGTLETEGLTQSLRYLADNCYLKYLLKELGLELEADGGPLDDINTFISFAQEFPTALEFIAYVDKMRDQAKKASERSWDDSVVISTIHRLKGLERKVVFGIGLGEGVINRGGIEQPVGLLPHTFSLTPPPNFGVLPGQSQSRVEDERCIAFVLISRAMERVVLSMPAMYMDMVLHPSRFISEIVTPDNINILGDA